MTTAIHALGWAIAAAIGYGIVAIWNDSARTHWHWFLPVVALGFAFIGGLMEWQLNDDDL